MEGPDLSYSCLLIHICWKADMEAKMEPPTQTEYFLSGGAISLICMVDEFLLHPVDITWKHIGASKQDGVGVQILTDVDFALHNAVVCSFMNNSRLGRQTRAT
ncbi:hypothetical protein DPMN_081693 [Dreissena polymorpha]|uniref:Ig-like domain-containing protein n=1 Tax=Dreissena polymorpha TaxID=45954 RepID=A0A9D4BI11_DREPO|nr:hypothetical protein DPMN_081693 [Dreissena polymorpha]